MENYQNISDDEDQFSSSKGSISNTEFEISKHNPNISKVNNKFGRRKIDKNFNWQDWSVSFAKSQLNEIHHKIMTINVEKEVIPDDYHELNKNQENVMKFLKDRVIKVKNCIEVKKRVGIIQGAAGTGKSYLLKKNFNYVIKQIGQEAVVILAPTGVAAKNVSGSTIHSFLKFGRKSNSVQPLVGEELLAFQDEGKNLKILLIDEYSMIGCRMMAGIEQRLRELKDSEEFFGGLIVVFFGDINQLIPVGDVPLFQSLGKDNLNNSLVERGKLLVNNFHFSFIISHNHRSTNSYYSSFLKRLSLGNCTKDDYQKVRGRMITMVKREELCQFRNAVKVCSTNAIVQEHNFEQLKGLNKPIAVINALNNCRTSFEASDVLADGLQNVIYLAENSRVMLRRNMNVFRGLVNGAIGTIFKILYDDDKCPPALPEFILVKFDNVSLIDVETDFVPLKAGLTSFYKNSIHCTRQQYYISLCWAITIHRGQGIGLGKMLLEVSDSDFTLGLLYVAFSRVSDLHDLILLRSITHERLNGIKNSKYYNERYKFLEWLKS
ncbi:ATP-dependent DNA helicase [Frankliniella fusca]|uniref:ATP-dependent DNA helicase n=1 Tax=Frankliniella fusca TaxID=407009 RepID=A0AAE1LN55_9NEOP|nr:ATP-dependent DNA helicase [Frankliniella fusca]